MTEDLLNRAKILYLVTQPMSWYARQVESVKTPDDGLTCLISLSFDQWQRDQRVKDTLSVMATADITRQFLNNGLHQSAEKIFSLTQTTSVAVHSLPPDAYAGLLPPDARIRGSAMKLVKLQHPALLRTEAAVAVRNGPPAPAAAKRLLQDIKPGLSHPARLVMDVCEHIGFTSRLSAMKPVTHLLSSLLLTLPDPKIVEDLRNAIRKDARGNANFRQTNEYIEDVARTANVFQARDINYPATLSEDTFVDDYKTASCKSTKQIFKSRSHRLPDVWYVIMGKKTWMTLSQVTLERAAAAWAWLQFFCARAEQFAAEGVSLSDGVFSKLQSPLQVLRFEGGSPATHNSWACLMWPLIKAENGDRVALLSRLWR